MVALSYSGETEELLRLLETIRRLGARLIAITGDPRLDARRRRPTSTLDCSVAEEACPMNLVPTASTTAALALGDALAMTLLVEKGFREEDFANLHPGGKLGKRLMRVESADARRRRGARSCAPTRAMRDVIHEMSSKRLGMTCVVDDAARLVGHHHRRRPAPADEPRRRRPGADGRRRDDAASRSRFRATCWRSRR